MSLAEIEAKIRRRDTTDATLKRLVKDIPLLRWWVNTPNDWLALVGMFIALADNSTNAALDDILGKTTVERFVNLIKLHAPHIPKLFRVEPVEYKLPEPPRDEITNEIIGIPANQTELGFYKTDYPEWFEYATKMATKPMSLKREIKAKRDQYRDEKAFYSNFDPEKPNPFLTGSVDEQSAFEKLHEEYAKFLKREAERHASLPTDPESPNLTALGQLANIDPAIREVLTLGQKIAADCASLEQQARDEQARETRSLLNIPDPALGQTGLRSRDQRRPMRGLAKLGSVEQERRQKAATQKWLADQQKSGETQS
jgi:hypothetical protein